MPELPEVQTTVDDLNKKVRGAKITDVWYDWHKFKAVEKSIGHVIEKVTRVGKNILIYFEEGQVLLVHQKMSGHLLVGKWDIENNKAAPISPAALKDKINSYIHFILKLDDGRMIGLSDLRKFGKVIFGRIEDIENLPELKKLGPDMLDPKLKFEEFADRIKKKSKTIYQTLMDQEVVTGIGNIYANDILFAARVNPLKKSSRLKYEELRALWESSKKILKLALKSRGTSIDDYRDTAGESGSYQNKRLVYQKEGEKCSRCKTIIKRLKKGGRSVCYCPKCQV